MNVTPVRLSECAQTKSEVQPKARCLGEVGDSLSTTELMVEDGMNSDLKYENGIEMKTGTD